jgi:hypothetical protein
MTKTQKRIVDPLDPRYRGVGGWLAFLIVSLTLLSPLALVSGILQESEYWARYSARVPHLLVVNRISNMIMVGIIAFSVYAGVGLWNEWPKAVRVAKVFLISLFVVSIILPFLPLTVAVPESVHDKVLDQAWYSVPMQLIYPVVWYSYLTYSRRVAATYGL